MAAKASRIHTLFLLVALTVVTPTATVILSPSVATAGSNGPTSNGDPDRPNDCPKPQSQPGIVAGPIVNNDDFDAPNPGLVPVEVRDQNGWSWAMKFIATLLGRHGL
jgi:hypothetical protein